MKASKTNVLLRILPALLLVVSVGLFLSGCRGDSNAGTSAEDHSDHDHSEHAGPMASTSETAGAPDPAATAETVQKLCPVMNYPINKAIFVEYEGKKVYFCCPGCPEQFRADPQAYLAKLPQFTN